MTVEGLRNEFEERQINKVRLVGFDIDGVGRGKYISTDKLFAVADSGFGFCDVLFAWDCDDVLYTGPGFTETDSGYPDLLARVDLDTMRFVPWELGTALFVIDFYQPDGQPLSIGPRQVLRRVLERARAMGFSVRASVEYEYFIFDETAHSLQEKLFQQLIPLTPGMFGYSAVRASSQADLVHAIFDGMAAYGVPLEGLHTETGPGVYETAIGYDEALTAADKAALFKTGVKEIAARRGKTATFMAKWNASLPGCSGHLHLSLWDEGGSNAFHAPGELDGASRVARQFVAGQLALMPDLCAVVCPTVNSYKRLVPGTWAPTTASWGVENRTAAVRWIPGSVRSTRFEYRLAPADANPYLVLAAAIASGLWGIERGLEPEAPYPGNVYDAPAGRFAQLPPTLDQATIRLVESQPAHELLGDAFVSHFAATRMWEWRQFCAAVTDWELRRYLEII
jgi:glutamine synthetase